MSPQPPNIDPAAIADALIAAYPDLDAAAASALIKAGHVVDVPAGQKILTCCGSFREVVWLLEGGIRIYRQAADGREVTLYHVTSGDLCPLSLYSLFHGTACATEAHSETRLLGIAVPSQEMLALVDRNPNIRHLLLKLLTGRLHELVELVSTNVFSRLELRLACLLGQLFGQSLSMYASVTHQKLANDLGCTREVVSRLLKGFERMGCIRLYRGRIELLSQAVLARLTEPKD
ncbi:MAG: Crp/Fnr family transcriptional regulator [Thiobacillus sp.]|nr:Crp/Fnr family transcriptional regulator [Thiobacillus sp.]